MTIYAASPEMYYIAKIAKEALLAGDKEHYTELGKVLDEMYSYSGEINTLKGDLETQDEQMYLMKVFILEMRDMIDSAESVEDIQANYNTTLDNSHIEF
jgi:hypothetical protein